jgi:hypothetical protein
VFHIVAWPFLGRIEGMLHFSHGLQVLVRSTIFIAPYTSFSHGVPDRRGLRRPNIDHRPQTSTTNRIKPACAVAVGQRMGQTKRRRNIIAIFGKHVHTLKNTSRFATFDKRVHTLSTHTIHDLPWCYSRYAIPRLTGTLLGSAKEPLGDLTYSLNC